MLINLHIILYEAHKGYEQAPHNAKFCPYMVSYCVLY